MRGRNLIFPVLGAALIPAAALAQASRPPASRANAPPAQSRVQSCNTAARSIALVLDASGSMNARLPNGETRIEVARRAVDGAKAQGYTPIATSLDKAQGDF